MQYPRIILKANKENSLKRFHPWVFSGAIDLIDDSIKDGDLVQVLDKNYDFLAYGTFQEQGSISVRLMSFNEKDAPDNNFILQKLYTAFDLRKQLGLLSGKTNICRLVHAEGDSLPGLIIDFYKNHIVIQANSPFAVKNLQLICTGIKKYFGENLKSIYTKGSDNNNKEGQHIFENIESCIAQEDGIDYNINWVSGQKTGFFIDQRENRILLGSVSKNKSVLNTFSYSGAFSMAALKGGATKVVSLDSSKKALELANENYELNKENFKGTHQSIQADAVEYVKSEDAKGFDIVVLDPPAFAKHRNAKHNAVQAYKRLNQAGISGIKSGGYLFTFSCSQVVDKPLFLNTVTAAAIEAKREIKILAHLSQPACHPVNIFHTEGEYLKGLMLQVI